MKRKKTTEPSNTKIRKIQPKINEKDFQKVEEMMKIWSEQERKNRKGQKKDFLHSLIEKDISKKEHLEKEDEYDRKERKLFEIDFLKAELQLYQAISKEILPQEIWEFKMEMAIHNLKNIIDLPWKNLFKYDQLPFGHEKNSCFVAALLIVEEFLLNPISVGLYRKHDDGFDAKDKEDNLDIVRHFETKVPSIKVEIGKNYGWTYSQNDVNEIYINQTFYDQTMKVTDEKSILIHAFMLAITILHEICHFKIRNFKEKNQKKSPPKFNESGNFFEKNLFHGKLAHIGLEYDIKKLIIIPTSSKALKRELRVEHIQNWFKKDFWESLKNLDEIIFKLKDLPSYQRTDEDYMEKEVLIAYNGMDAIDYLKCGTYFL